MLAGYLIGPWFAAGNPRRRGALLLAGSSTVLFFALLRATNWYGDPAPWRAEPTLLASMLSFVNCEKYPPSLLFLAMTLGPALLMLGALDQVQGKAARFFITFGRVPFFFYLLHLYLAHAVGVILSALNLAGERGPDTAGQPATDFGLPAVYLSWMLIILALYPFCAWFAKIKQTRRDWWLSYL
jgi:uncharacterized membrane protein